jgi:hypothetical protein
VKKSTETMVFTRNKCQHSTVPLAQIEVPGENAF